MNPKPGYKTTEFWTMLGLQAISILVLLGVIPAEDQANLAQAIKDSVIAVAMIVGQVAFFIKYVQSRIEAKTIDPLLLSKKVRNSD